MPAPNGQAKSKSRSVKRGGVCPGQNGTAARRAYFGPDYQSPSLASLPSRRTGAPGHTACEPSARGHSPGDTRGNKRPGKRNPWPHISRKCFGTTRRDATTRLSQVGCKPLVLTPLTDEWCAYNEGITKV